MKQKSLANEVLNQAKLQYKNRLIPTDNFAKSRDKFWTKSNYALSAIYENSLTLGKLNLVFRRKY